MAEVVISPAVVEAAAQILRHGGVVELKREQGRIVVIEINRKVKIKD